MSDDELNPYEQGLHEEIERLEAENKLLNEQMASIEEMGTESLNALPDCLMRLAPALVRVGELEELLGKLVLCEDAEFYPTAIERSSPYCIDFEEWHKEAIALLKGEANE